ncbi:MAG: glycosyltransferase family A protein [Candidatus Acidiferrales bacterium]
MKQPTLTPPLVSILIVNYNYGRFIATAIDSALSQTYPSVEVIVVDDGSTDNSRQVIDGYGSRVRAIYKQNGGQPSATNAAFNASSGDVICLLDSDDYFERDKVEKIVRTYQQHPEAFFVFHPLRRMHIDGTDHGSLEPLDGSRRLDYRRTTNKFAAPPTSGLSFRRSGWLTFRSMPEELNVLGDNYITFVIMALRPGYYVCEPLATMRLHGDNIFSMGVSQAARLPADVKVALAMRRNFPNLVRQADRLVSITVAKCWKIKLNDGPTSVQLDTYFRDASFASKFTIYAGAVMRCAKHSIFNLKHGAKSQSVGDFPKPVHSDSATSVLGARK